MFFRLVTLFSTISWLLTNGIALNMIVCTYARMSKDRFVRIQYFIWRTSFIVPLVGFIVFVCTGDLQIGLVLGEANTGTTCEDYVPFAVTCYHSIIFCLSVLFNMIAFVLVMIKLCNLLAFKQRNSREKSVTRRKNILFYSFLSLAMGFWRIPGMIYFLERLDPTTMTLNWTADLNAFFVPSECFVVVVFYTGYFRLLKRMKKRFHVCCRTTTHGDKYLERVTTNDSVTKVTGASSSGADSVDLLPLSETDSSSEGANGLEKGDSVDLPGDEVETE